jgi:hypothetical protein
MTPGSALYKATDWVDNSQAGRVAVQRAQQILNAAPAIGDAAALAKDVWTGNYGNLGQDIKQTQADTTNYFQQYPPIR